MGEPRVGSPVSPRSLPNPLHRMFRTSARLLFAALALAPLANAHRIDEGMWLFNRPPAAQMKARY